uniref:Interferon alpha inducible protein 27 like 2 n=1 Tax=Canis lupus familiaris TaxID=9615 RepID=A0A8C0N3D4_CANLF
MMKQAAFAVVGGVAAVAAVPVALGAAGFTGAGIAASSLAAKMMSAAAVANGGGVAAGSLVATLQSVGAAGLCTSTKVLLASLGSGLGAYLGKPKKESSSPPEEPRAEGEQQEETESQAEPPNPPVGFKMVMTLPAAELMGRKQGAKDSPTPQGLGSM